MKKQKNYRNSTKAELLFKFKAKQLLLKTLFTFAPKIGAAYASKTFATPFIRKFRAKELEILGQSKKFRKSIRGKDIQLYEWGTGSKIALLVHGWEGHAGHLGAFALQLKEEGYKVIAFDNPAHGLSGGRRTHIFTVSKVIAHLIQEYQPDVLISHSFGSGASMLALHDNPELYIPKFVMVTAPDKVSDIFKVFTNAMALNKRAYQYIQSFVEGFFDRRFEEIQFHLLGPKIRAGNVLLIHDKKDGIIPWMFVGLAVQMSVDKVPCQNKVCVVVRPWTSLVLMIVAIC